MEDLSQYQVELSVVRKEVPFRLSARDSDKVAGFLAAFIAMVHPIDQSHRFMRSQTLA